jgi:hypothetical protein
MQTQHTGGATPLPLERCVSRIKFRDQHRKIARQNVARHVSCCIRCAPRALLYAVLRFREQHQKIPAPYVLVTGHSDEPCPGAHVAQLEDPKVLHWYGNNPTQAHPKFSPSPIGLNAFYHSHAVLSIRSRGLHKKPKDRLAVANFYLGSHHERGTAWSILCGGAQPWLSCISKTSYIYPAGEPLTPELEQFLPFKFWVSPRGNGLDCHRTWEALYLGAIPIVKTSALDPLYAGLPVLIVDAWDKLSEEFLNAKYEELRPDRVAFDESKLHKTYWRQAFDQHKHAAGRLTITAK